MPAVPGRARVVLAGTFAAFFVLLTVWLLVRTPGSLPAITALVVLASAALAGVAVLVVPVESTKAAASFGAVFVGCAALLAALLAIPTRPGSSAGGSPPTGAGSAAEPSGKREVARFSGVVGNFASSRAFLTFLADHDDEPVRLDRVGFNEATFEDVITQTVEVDGKNVVRVTSVQIFPDCTPPISGDESPSIGRGCGATSFEIVGEQIAQACGYLTHAVSVYDGYFRVDVTGILSQGVTPVKLEPMTEEQATRP